MGLRELCEDGGWTEAQRARGGRGRRVLRLPGVHVVDTECCTDHKGFFGPGYKTGHGVVLSRSGAYRWRQQGEESWMDATAGYLVRPGDEVFTAHPLGTGDRSTEIALSPEVFGERFDGGDGRRKLVITGRTDLRHRALMAAIRRGTDDFELAERLHQLLDEVAASTGCGGYDGTPPLPAQRVHQRLVADVCAALATGSLNGSLDALAARVGASPHHLSRVFRRVTGRTLTEYRNELRIRAVLQDIEDGRGGLRALAAAYEFADQAHLTRVMRRHTGEPPSAVRELLGCGRVK
ncbi:helix-turn-helix transcriptional regulator [Streptomyces sp. TRM66268-LWL]|uniref:Helix-turn-helix transcriptional regulator n=1 Tax=Streptomyces polyasparticus TaxID=2767826 RepID=A0ABR7S9A5_9ACTN|nr:helix-turn-helix domain-containing protein [Streptomyces polyasparticus]MBC9712050.1 helix-turn-helix transcriptional regulator [Streptomyces polyasparticus]